MRTSFQDSVCANGQRHGVYRGSFVIDTKKPLACPHAAWLVGPFDAHKDVRTKGGKHFERFGIAKVCECIGSLRNLSIITARCDEEG